MSAYLPHTGHPFLTGATLSSQDVAKVVQEKYFDRAEGDVRMNLMVLAAKSDEN
jgi:hypothetical protein